MLLSDHSYDVAFKRQMNAYHEELWQHLALVPALEPQTRNAVMEYLLELACQAQNERNIDLGRRAILGLPRAWLLQHLETYAEPLLQLEDEWEYRRLGEIYLRLDEGLVRRLAARGLESRDEGIREAAQDFLGALSNG
ncbi:MAG: hypothetical protein M3Q65_22415 [Chloroflexota bacterium]|nr:hypothetical protein [Chloroflexota bacterium]